MRSRLAAEGDSTAKARIAVIKRAFHKDVTDKCFPHLSAETRICPAFEGGQTFEIGSPSGSRPEGFRDWAWADIRKVVALTMMGANSTPAPSPPAAAAGFDR